MNSTRNHTNSLGSEIVGNGNDFQFYKEAHSLQVLRLIIQVLLAAVGVAGNAIVCLVITFQPQMHTTINYFIRNLAIADLGILIL